MDEIMAKAWRVFRSAFKDGESVVVERDDGRFFWGTLTAHEDEVLLTRPNGYSVTLDWERIEFMAHDGFPVKSLMKMTKAEAAERARKTSTSIIVEMLERGTDKRSIHNAIVGDCKRAIREDRAEVAAALKARKEAFYAKRLEEDKKAYAKEGYWPVHGGGCPYIAEGRLIKIHDRGARDVDGDGCEVLVFEARNGARLHNYDSDHLFLVA